MTERDLTALLFACLMAGWQPAGHWGFQSPRPELHKVLAYGYGITVLLAAFVLRMRLGEVAAWTMPLADMLIIISFHGSVVGICYWIDKSTGDGITINDQRDDKAALAGELARRSRP